MNPAAPTIAVVVPTHRRPHGLPALIRALDTQTVRGSFEVIVVDDGSRDETTDILQRLRAKTTHQFTIVTLDWPKGPATARNIGWRSTTASCVAFIDDDCIPAPGWLAALERALGEKDLVQGPTEPNPDQYDRRGLFSRTMHVTKPTGFFEACNIAYRRKILEEVRGFDERFSLASGEDTDLGWRSLAAGARSGFEARAKVYHDIHPSSYVAYLKNIKRWSGVVEVATMHPQIRMRFGWGPFWLPHHAPTVLAAAGLLTSIALASRSRWSQSAVAAVLSMVPYVDLRMRRRPLPGTLKRRAAALPLTFVADVYETLLHIVTLARVRLRVGRPAGRTAG